MAAVMMLGMNSAMAQDVPAPAPGSAAAAEQSARRAELDAITHDIEVTKERQDALQAEIARLEQDSTSLNTALVDTGDRAQELE